MQFWKISKSDQAPDGVIMVKVTVVNHAPLLELCQEKAGPNYQLNVGATLLLDIEFYKRYMENLFAYINDSFNPKAPEAVVEQEPEVAKEPTPPAHLIIDHLKNSKRSIVRESKTSDSLYIFGVYEGKVYEYRESDHDKNHEGYASITSLRECEFGEKVKIGSIFRNARVTYSTEFKTTTTNNEGRKESYLTSFVNSEMEKLK